MNEEDLTTPQPDPTNWVQDDQDRWVYWPTCPIKGCQNRTCKTLHSNYCFPHTHHLVAEVIINTGWTWEEEPERLNYLKTINWSH